jgi:hypothetical protein
MIKEFYAIVCVSCHNELIKPPILPGTFMRLEKTPYGFTLVGVSEDHRDSIEFTIFTTRQMAQRTIDTITFHATQFEVVSLVVMP